MKFGESNSDLCTNPGAVFLPCVDLIGKQHDAIIPNAMLILATCRQTVHKIIVLVNQSKQLGTYSFRYFSLSGPCISVYLIQSSVEAVRIP